MATDTRTLTVSLVANTRGFQSDINNARRQMTLFGTGAKGLSGSLVGMAKSFGLLAGAGGAVALLTGTLKSGVTTAISFESAFASVKKTVDATTEEYAAMRKELIELSKQTGATAESLFEAAGSAGQLGVAKENIVEFTRVMSEMGIASNLTADEAAVGFAKWSNITQLTTKELDNLTSSVVALGNKTGATEAEILAISLRFAGAAKAVGLTDAKIAGLAASIVEVGIEAEAGGSAVINIFNEMQRAVAKGGDQLDLFAALAGKSAKEFSNAFKTDAAGALLDVAGGFNDFVKAGGESVLVMDKLGLDGVRVGIAMQGLAGNIEGARENLDLATTAFADNVARSAEAEERYKTAANKIDAMKASFAALVEEIGQKFIPIVNDSVDAVTKLIDSMADAVDGDDGKGGVGAFAKAIGRLSPPKVEPSEFDKAREEYAGIFGKSFANIRRAFGNEVKETNKEMQSQAAKVGENTTAAIAEPVTENNQSNAAINAIVNEDTALQTLFKKIGKGFQTAKDNALDFWESSKNYAMKFGGQIGEIWDENFNWEKDPERQREFIDSIFDALIKAGDEHEKKEQERLRAEQERLKLIDEENAKQQKMMDEQLRAREKEKELLRDMLNQDVGAFQAQRRGSYTGFTGGVVGISAEGMSEVARRAASTNNARTGPDASVGLLQGILTAAQATAQNTRNGQLALAG